MNRPVAPDGPEEGTAAHRLLDRLEEAGEALRSRRNAELAGVLGRAAARLLAPGDGLRDEALRGVAAEAGFSPAMARLVVDRMAADWTEDRLLRLLEAEFRDPRVLEGFADGPGGDRLRAVGDPVAFHVGAGTVAGVGATSILRSLLVRTPLLLKPGRGDRTLPTLLARAIEREDPALGRAVAVRYWRGGLGPPLEEVALKRAGRVVVYGSDETVGALGARLPRGTPLVAYRHRVSVGAVGRERLEGEGTARASAGAAARAVAAYEQRGCVSPRLIWVEAGGSVSPAGWAALLAEELGRLAEELPPGRPEPEVAARIQQLRGTAELRAASGAAVRVHAPRDLGWTVLYEEEAPPGPGCTGRLISVRPLSALSALPEMLAPWSRALQSVGLEADEERRAPLAEALARMGVSRVTTFDRQPWPLPWWTHDGHGPLRVLVRWSTLEAPGR